MSKRKTSTVDQPFLKFEDREMADDQDEKDGIGNVPQAGPRQR